MSKDSPLEGQCVGLGNAIGAADKETYQATSSNITGDGVMVLAPIVCELADVEMRGGMCGEVVDRVGETAAAWRATRASALMAPLVSHNRDPRRPAAGRRG